MTEFSELVGEILVQIDGKKGDELMIFHTAQGEKYALHHEQD